MQTTLQSPLLDVPTKRTDETDFKESFYSYIESAYGEKGETYEKEVGILNKLRQDIRGAGKDITGRDILYRYYGQLELLDLRFPIDEKHVKVLFNWYDAFTNEAISQHSVAYEKACVIFNIAATCSSIAASQNRFETTGQKVAFNYLQCAAGLFGYINDNFLHAPSADLSRDCIKVLVDLMLAQAQECFLEKVISEKKKSAMISKLAAHCAHAYTNVASGLAVDAIKYQFEKAWADFVKVKSKHYLAMAHYHKALQAEESSKYGGMVFKKAKIFKESVAHLNIAESLSKEANKLASGFGKSFSSFTSFARSSSSGSDKTSSSAALMEGTKVMYNLITEKKTKAQRENDLIYHDVVPNVDTLQAIEKLCAVKPTTFADVCTNGQADIPNIIGPDIFLKLIPLSVHESESKYSEEKAKILRSEQERIDRSDAELQASLDSLDISHLLEKLKRYTMGGQDAGFELTDEAISWQNQVNSVESGKSGSTSTELQSVLIDLKRRIKDLLDEIGQGLDKEHLDCEAMRDQYKSQWTQEPSATLTRHFRDDIQKNREAFDRANETDQQLLKKLSDGRPITDILKRSLDEVCSLFAVQVSSSLLKTPTSATPTKSLLEDMGGTENGGLGALGEQVIIEKLEGMLTRVRTLKKERASILEELRSKIHGEDISSLLILNKNREAQVFETELGKFKDHQMRISNNLRTQNQLLQDIAGETSKLTQSSQSIKNLEIRERKKYEVLKEWKRGYDNWKEAVDGLTKGVQFYSDLLDIVESLRRNSQSFINSRIEDRNNLVKRLNDEQAAAGQRLLKEQLNRLNLAADSARSPVNPYVPSPVLPQASLANVPSYYPSHNPAMAIPAQTHPSGSPYNHATSNLPTYSAPSSFPVGVSQQFYSYSSPPSQPNASQPPGVSNVPFKETAYAQSSVYAPPVPPKPFTTVAPPSTNYNTGHSSIATRPAHSVQQSHQHPPWPMPNQTPVYGHNPTGTNYQAPPNPANPMPYQHLNSTYPSANMHAHPSGYPIAESAYQRPPAPMSYPVHPSAQVPPGNPAVFRPPPTSQNPPPGWQGSLI